MLMQSSVMHMTEFSKDSRSQRGQYSQWLYMKISKMAKLNYSLQTSDCPIRAFVLRTEVGKCYLTLPEKTENMDEIDAAVYNIDINQVTEIPSLRSTCALKAFLENISAVLQGFLETRQKNLCAYL